MVGTIDVVSNAQARGIAALKAVGGSEVVFAVRFEECGALMSEIVHATRYALLRMMRGIVIGIGQRNPMEVAREATQIGFHLHDLRCAAPREIDFAVVVFK